MLICVWLCHSMDWSSPGSPVDEIFQARILKWFAMFSSRASSGPRDWTKVSCCLLHWQVDSLPLSRLGSPTNAEWSSFKVRWLVLLGSPGGASGQESTYQCRRLKRLPGSGRSPGVGNSTHFSILAWKIHGQRSLVDYSPRSGKELDITEWLKLLCAHILSHMCACTHTHIHDWHCYFRYRLVLFDVNSRKEGETKPLRSLPLIFLYGVCPWTFK